MKLKIPVAALILAVCTLPVCAESIYQPVDLSAKVNARLQGADPRYVEGNVMLGGVPFCIPAGGNNQWNFGTAYGDAYVGTATTDFPIGITGVTEVHTLMHTAWGAPGPTSYLALEFVGSRGAHYRKDLIGGVDIRDWNNWQCTNTINGTTTINVESYDGGQHRRDKQCIALPADFLTQRLECMRIIDSGAYNLQRGCISGMTVLRDVPTHTVGLSNRAFGDTVVAASESMQCFAVFGRVHWVDAATFTLDDGSGMVTTVHAPGYSGISEQDFARAVGVVGSIGGRRALMSEASRVRKL